MAEGGDVPGVFVGAPGDTARLEKSSCVGKAHSLPGKGRGVVMLGHFSYKAKWEGEGRGEPILMELFCILFICESKNKGLHHLH